MEKFEAGKTYMMRSACDHECVWKFTVMSRTAQMITIKDEYGKVRKCRVSKTCALEESIFPLGRYSMAPILRASRVC